MLSHLGHLAQTLVMDTLKESELITLHGGWGGGGGVFTKLEMIHGREHEIDSTVKEQLI